MAGYPFWDWFKHRLKEFRKMKLKVDEYFNIQTLLHDKHIEQKLIFRGILAF